MNKAAKPAKQLEVKPQNERLKRVRKEMKMNQRDFATLLNIKQGTLSDIERGRISVSSKISDLLVRKLHVNPGWFLKGEGDIFSYKKQGVDSGVSQGVPWNEWVNEPRHHVNIEYIRRLRKDLKLESPDVSSIVENYLLLANFQDFIGMFIPEYLSEVRRVMIGRVDPNNKEIGYTDFKKLSVEALKKYTVLKPHLQKIANSIVKFYHDFEPYDTKNLVENYFDASE